MSSIDHRQLTDEQLTDIANRALTALWNDATVLLHGETPHQPPVAQVKLHRATTTLGEETIIDVHLERDHEDVTVNRKATNAMYVVATALTCWWGNRQKDPGDSIVLQATPFPTCWERAERQVLGGNAAEDLVYPACSAKSLREMRDEHCQAIENLEAQVHDRKEQLRRIKNELFVKEHLEKGYRAFQVEGSRSYTFLLKENTWDIILLADGEYICSIGDSYMGALRELLYAYQSLKDKETT